MSRLNRRSFLRHAAGVAGAGMTGFVSLGAWACSRHDVPGGQAPTLRGAIDGGYGPLAQAGPELSLPEGFQYRRLASAGSTMSDGLRTPGLHDGMAAFPLPNGNIRLIRNHEVLVRDPDAPIPQPVYDTGTGGGTTSLEIDPRTRELVRDYVSLSGTARNCAGGPTPWGSWLTCEEIVVGPLSQEARSQLPIPVTPRDSASQRIRIQIQQAHGYVFEVPVDAESPVRPVPLKAMGRFVHEAIAVDPDTGIIYETEDASTAGFYRFLPNRPGVNGASADLSAGGRLEILAIRERPEYDCSKDQTVGASLPVSWVPIDDPDPSSAERNPLAVFQQGRDGGAARFTRVEGCWYGDRQIYFTCTDGGDAGRGQVWSYRPDADGGLLTLVFESPGPEVLEHPDNLCVSPRGGILLCEDGDGQNFVRGLTPEGRLFDFALNIESDSEFAGSTFSPDGQTLFLNIQNPGATFAIWGPWERGAL